MLSDSRFRLGGRISLPGALAEVAHPRDGADAELRLLRDPGGVGRKGVESAGGRGHYAHGGQQNDGFGFYSPIT